MRISAVALLLGVGGCSFLPGLEEPELTIAPQLVLLEVRGTTNMLSATQTGPFGPMPLTDFGVGDRDADYGGSLRLGDGFSGVELGFTRLENKSSDEGLLTNDWGNLLAGDTVKSQLDGLEIRLRYLAGLFDHELDNGVRIQLGAGAAVGYRGYTFKSFDINGVRRQEIDIQDDGMPYAAARGRVSYLGFGAQVDYGINPDVPLGGDFDGLTQDLELLATYTFEDQNITAHAGYRRTWLEADGREGPLWYEIDLTIDGYVLGLEFTF